MSMAAALRSLWDAANQESANRSEELRQFKGDQLSALISVTAQMNKYGAAVEKSLNGLCRHHPARKIHNISMACEVSEVRYYCNR
jgi:hypothetical protein